ncbi:lysophospholipase [Cricetibacter osteomyelitidis]|uniref:Lysophospholipase n=1 Tax=Cricetibacter osteomyelitidis TaxID=1521931 RepID=A0A4R2T4J7_9PAST|nr:alpha/beta hydrolase [Cricetibacter osteomyelitidis]TCP97280.1 lysophospholipase [Cricetibacter osteomyelitidis]
MNREPYFCQFALKELLPFAEQFPLQYVQGNGNVKIAYRHFVHTDNRSQKLVIIVNGRSENILKWTEVAYDFYQQGYDVLAFDHRGQGYSQRLLTDTDKGYLDQFRFYADDMDIVIETVNAQYQYAQQHIIAHSLGALISTFYLADYPHNIKSAVFSAPFFQFHLNRPLLDEIIVHLMVLFGQGKRYVFGKTAYKQANLDNNELSFCKTRMKWMNRINRKYPAIHLGGPTFRWVHLLLNAMKKLPRAIRKVNIPILILYSEKEKIVSNKNLAKLTALFLHCETKQINHAKHEILFERDHIRELAMKEIFQFFNK